MKYRATTKEHYIKSLVNILKGFTITSILTGERGMSILRDTDYDMNGIVHMPSFDSFETDSESINGYPSTSYTMIFMKVDDVVAILKFSKVHEW